jgi:hypothetical protein
MTKKAEELQISAGAIALTSGMPRGALCNAQSSWESAGFLFHRAALSPASQWDSVGPTMDY